MSDIKLDMAGLRGLDLAIKKLGDDKDKFFEMAIKNLAARLLSKVIDRTPVGVKPDGLDAKAAEYWEGYIGGTLRRGWTAKTEKQAMEGTAPDLVTHAAGLQVEKSSGSYVVTIINPVKYASYVEYGHRQEPGRFVPALGKRLKKSFVPGQYMLTISEKELETQAPAILQKRIIDFLKGAFLSGK